MEFLGNIPSTLYKYRVWEDDSKQKRILTENEIYFSSANEFNDPFDASLPFVYDEKDLTQENIYKKLVTVAQQVYPNLNKSQLHDLALKRMSEVDFSDQFSNELQSKIISDQHKMFGIYCLTSKADNLLMWSHYANCHKGLCIGFDKYILFKETQAVLGPITYSNTFPTMPLFENDLKEKGKALATSLMTKSKHWEYEDEYRLIIFMDMIVNQTLKLSQNAFKEIIFGCKMKPEKRDEIIQIAKRRFPNIKLYDAQFDRREFKLNIFPVINSST